MNPDPLEQLHAYHLPDPVSWWPPAPGWWLLALLVVAGSAIGLWLFMLRRRRRAALRSAQTALRALKAEHDADGDDLKLIRGLSRLLRRFALARFPRTMVAGLTGDAWLGFLDRHTRDNAFTHGVGRSLVEAPYRPQAELPISELSALVEQWIGRNPGGNG